jgi:AcrR family transcriptional regulator
MPRYKESERQQAQSETRQLLVQAAIQEFARQGYERANINHISRAAGFAKGTIYNYFPSKQVLLLEIIDQVAGMHFAFIAERVRQASDPQQRLESFFEAGFEFVRQHLAPARVMLTTLYGSDPLFKARMYQAYLPTFHLLNTEIVEPGIAQGLFRPVDPDATALLLMSLYLGTASQLNDQGQIYMHSALVADFALHALQKKDENNDELG